MKTIQQYRLTVIELIAVLYRVRVISLHFAETQAFYLRIHNSAQCTSFNLATSKYLPTRFMYELMSLRTEVKVKKQLAVIMHGLTFSYFNESLHLIGEMRPKSVGATTLNPGRRRARSCRQFLGDRKML